MKVKDLIAELGKCDPEMPVLFSSDEEGNTIHRRAEVAVVELDDYEGDAVVIYPINSSDDIS